MTLRILFFGTSEHGAPFLESLLANRHHRVVGVVTPAPLPIKGFGPRALLRRVRRAFERGTTRDLARRARLPIWERGLALPAFAEFASRLQPDLFVVASFNRILKPEILSLAPRGVINVHPSLLPKYRGADPIFWAIVNNETETGVTIHWMDAGLDTGPILCQRVVTIPPGANGTELSGLLTCTGVGLLAEALDQVENGLAAPRSQEERSASYFPPASKEVRIIHWEDGAEVILRLVRASTPYGGALAQVGGRRVNVVEAERVAPSFAGAPGHVLYRNGPWIEISCRDAVLKLLLAGGTL